MRFTETIGKIMKIVMITELPVKVSTSPKGKFASAEVNISVALGRKPGSMDLRERHPFDVQICRIPSKKSSSPFHAHTAQWEYFQVLSGSGQVRHQAGITNAGTGHAFLFEPGEAHQITNLENEDLVLLIIADNPVGEAVQYPDSGKWSIEVPDGPVLRSKPLDYFDGEE